MHLFNLINVLFALYVLFDTSENSHGYSIRQNGELMDRPLPEELQELMDILKKRSSRWRSLSAKTNGNTFFKRLKYDFGKIN